MAVGDIYMDGGRPPSVSAEQACKEIIEAGLWSGAPEELWNLHPNGELSHIFELHQMAMELKGHKFQMEIDNGKRIML